MRKNVQEVIAAFEARKAKGGKSSNIRTDGSTIFSYYTEIARWNEDGTVWITEERSSNTTNGQIRACEELLGYLTRCQDLLHPDCLRDSEMARECSEFTRTQLMLKREGRVG